MVVGIIGLGLLGGSLAIRLSQSSVPVCGFARTPAKITNNPSCDFPVYGTDAMSELRRCDVVFVCTPLSDITAAISEIAPYIDPGTVVTDIGSVKSPIMQYVCKCDFPFQFVGGHPMAGTEKSGFDNAFPSLFEGRPWVLTSPHTQLESIINTTGARIIYADPTEHDLAVAFISHLPLLISIKLQQTIDNIEQPTLRHLAVQLASSGYESMTRLARGNQQLNSDILRMNADNVQLALEAFCHAIR